MSLKGWKIIAGVAIAGAATSCNNPASSLLTVKPSTSPKALAVEPPIEAKDNITPAGTEGKVSAVAAGFQHHCAIIAESLKCWGLNRHGEIGNGESGLASDAKDPVTGAAGTPRVVTRPHTVFSEGVTGVAVGYEHTCAIHRGSLKCFGSNQFYQLGLASEEKGKAYEAPIEVLTKVKQVAARGRVTCAVTENKELYCWGTRLANTGTELKPQVLGKKPKKIPLENVEKVALSGTHTCALASAKLYCWGMNAVGELGNGDAGGQDQAAPIQVPLANVTDFALSEGRTCAVSDGKVYCFGASLGDREIDRKTDGGWKIPERTPYLSAFWNGLLPVTQITASGAAIAKEDVYYGSFFHNEHRPRKVAIGVVRLDFSEADLAGCMLFKNLQVYCWGPNTFGQLGQGTRSMQEPAIYQAVPIKVNP